MKQYLELLRDVRHNGVKKKNRTKTGTLSVFGRQMRFDLSRGFPAVTTKKLFMKAVIVELIWFLRGNTNIKYLVDKGVHIWDEWADPEGNLGPVYGGQWRRWDAPDGRKVDQISRVINQIKTNPDSRRLIVSAWNVADIHKMKLPPCHCLFQFYVANGKLSCQLYQRSCDMFLGVPFNIASYSLLTIMIAKISGLKPGEFIHTLGDTHIYLNHLKQVDIQLSRKPRPLPKLVIKRKVNSLFKYRPDDFKLVGYDPWPPIKGEVSV